MDIHSLVSYQHRCEGEALIEELTGDLTIDVMVAFWLNPVDVGYWSLYLASTALGSMNNGDAFHWIYEVMKRVNPKAIGLSDLKVVLPTDPIARDAIEHRDHGTNRPPFWLSDVRLGDLEAQAVYLYPRIGGVMGRDEVVRTVAALMSRSGDPTPSSVTLSDGSSIQAVPTSLRRKNPGGLEIVLHDPTGNTDRTVLADEVVSIR